MVNVFCAQRVLKTPLVLLTFAITLKGFNTLLTFAITLKGINTLRGKSKDNQDIISPVQRESYPDIKLIHKMLTDNLLSINGISNH